ncbi:MAG: tetratricopeptide repeat protein [Burkholderiales bacterium]
MKLKDHRGYEVSGASPSSLVLFEDALRLFQSWRGDPRPLLAQAIEQSPVFVMAHVLRSYVLLCSREFSNVKKARDAMEAFVVAVANDREREHLAIVGALLNSQYESAQAMLSSLLDRYPSDVLALQVAHAFDYILGNTKQLRDRVSRIAPFWSRDMPGYSALAAMHAFGSAENGRFSEAFNWCEQSLELDPGNPRAHHAIAHVFEMTQQFAAGSRWLEDHAGEWAETSVSTHCWWHLALFHLRAGQISTAFGIYDEHIRKRQSASVSELIDASSLLWRMDLVDHDTGGRWTELAGKWMPYVGEGFCAFNDMHAMMALAGLGRWQDATALIQSQILRARESDTNAMMTRTVGLPACQGILAFARGRHAQAADLLSRLPEVAYRLGGSNAQHGIIAMTLEAARLRTPRAHSTSFWLAA